MVYSRTESICRARPSAIRPHIAPRSARPAMAGSGHGFFRRLQYRGLRVMGPDRRQSRSRPCLRPLSRAQLSCAEPGYSHPPRAGWSVSRLRRAANCDRAGAASTTNLRSSSASIAGVSHPERARQRRNGDRPGVQEGVGFKPVSRPSAAMAAARGGGGIQVAAKGPLRRGVGVAGMWYGCGNTSLPNPSTMRRWT